MCDSNNNNNNCTNYRNTNINRTWLLKLLLAGLLIQHVAAASLATIVERNFDDDNNDDVAAAAASLANVGLPLVVQSRQHQLPPHRTVVAATATIANIVDSSVPAGVSEGIGGGGDGVGNANSIVVDTLAEVDEYSNNDDNAAVVNNDGRDDDDDDDMDVDMEFAGYLNDFNIQHEVSIPEDLFDQQHIDEKTEYAKDNNEADVILESQRSTSRNFTTFHNNYNYNNNNGRSNNNKNYNNDDNYRRKKKKTINNKKKHYKKFKSSNNNYNNDNNQRHGSVHATENKAPNNLELFDGSIKTEQKHQQQQQQKQQHPQQQLLDINKNLNERKFNKLSSVENLNDDDNDDDNDENAEDDDVAVVVANGGMTWSSSNQNKQQNSQNIDDLTSSGSSSMKAEQTAIGDIENDFINEDEVGRTWRKISTDNDASSAEVADVAAESDFASLASAAATSSSTITSRTTTLPTTTTKTAAMQHMFVGRKTKRHGIRTMQQRHLDDEPQRLSALQTNDKHARHHHNNNNKNDNDENTQRQLEQQQQQHTEAAKSAFSSAYFGMPTNDSNQDSNIRNHDVLKDTQTDVQFEQKDAVNDTPLSAFEQHKALRRNNRRTGHKSHKKKYKDYLRYNVIVVSTELPTTTTTTTLAAATTTIAATNNTAIDAPDKTKAQQQLKSRQQQRTAKLAAYNKDMDKLQRLPAAAAPIFVVAQRRAEGSARPYYEGQLSYYMETKDDEDNAAVAGGGVGVGAADGYVESIAAAAAAVPNAADVGKIITSEATERNNNWYRRMSPILRNGRTQSEQHQRQHNQQHHHNHHHHHYNPHHQQHHSQHQPHHLHQQQHQHQHHGKQHHAYQRRRLSPKKIPTTTAEQQPPLYLRTRYTPPLQTETEDTETAAQLAPLPPPSYRGGHKGALQELGHQITQMEEFDRYYSKWPHLARVQYQLNDEDYREAHPELLFTGNADGLKSKPDADYDYHLQHDVVDDEELIEDDEEEAEDEDANLPPYIKKYNRRNKQLLNLLEGTLPPPTPPMPPKAPKPSLRNKNYSWSSSVLQPGPVETSAVRIDDDYLKEKRRRYHNRNHNNNNNKNLEVAAKDAAAAAAHASTATAKATTKAAAAATKDAHEQEPQQQQQQQNNIPGDDVDISSQEFDDWEREIETRMTGSEKMKWQIEKTSGAAAAAATTVSALAAAPLGPTTTTTTTLKPAIYRLPSYPAFAGSFIGKPRSRSAQFAPSSGSNRRIGATANRGNSFINALQSGNTGNYKSMPHLMAGNKFDAESERGQGSSSSSNTNNSPPDFSLANYDSNNSIAAAATAASLSNDAAAAAAVGAKPLANSFVYHRVEAAPRLVGAGSTGGRKQRLPFVAITDRRLETSKKSSPLYEQQLQQQRDFEQNHYPMP